MMRWRAAARTASSTLLGALDLLYPPVCAACGQPVDFEESGKRFVCADCARKIEPLPRPWCLCCGDPREDGQSDLCERCAHAPFTFAWARSVGWYKGVLTLLIQQLKYEGERALVSELVPLLADFLTAEKLLGEFDAITFVPMSSLHRRERGYNQAELLARRVAKILQKPAINSLKKTRETLPQMQLSGEERRRNLSGAFTAVKSQQLGRMLLIDDVYTTGATAHECSRALLEGGAERVVVLTLARTPVERHEQSASDRQTQEQSYEN